MPRITRQPIPKKDPTMPERDAMRCAQPQCTAPNAALVDIDTDTDSDYVLGRCKACDAWTAVERPRLDDIRADRSARLRVSAAYFLGGMIAGLFGGTKPTSGPKRGPTRAGPPDGVPWPTDPRG